MNFFFDTEFLEDGKTIELISIGIVAEDGREFYAEVMLPMWGGTHPGDFRLWQRIQEHPWLMENVVPHLRQAKDPMAAGNTKAEIAQAVLDFVNERPTGTIPKFWAYYASYDWVVLCQLYGTMLGLPEGWPMFVRDIKQLAEEVGGVKLLKQPETDMHDALNDARWNAQMYNHIRHIEQQRRSR